MKLPTILFCLALISLTGCEKPAVAETSATRQTLNAGFWIWGDNPAYDPLISEPLDYLYFQAGELPTRQPAWVAIPQVLPPAREYWAVFRARSGQVPASETAGYLAAATSRLQKIARIRGIKLSGVQLDIDVPTGSLHAYAEWLKLLKPELPPGAALSVTGLLDWFSHGRDGIVELVSVVDEFVPQFYDIGDDRYGMTTMISAPVNSAKWGPIFNQFRKRYRIGVSSFGRGRSESKRNFMFFRQPAPADLATNPAFEAHSRRSESGENVVEYRALRAARLGYQEFAAGSAVQFILPSPDSIRTAVDGASRMGAYCNGVIFFRWPTNEETLTMQSHAVLEAARVRAMESGFAASGIRILTTDGECATVACDDLYIESTHPPAAAGTKYRIRSSVEFEYFIPEQNIPVRVTGPDQLELILPPYFPLARLRLGRAVTASRANFSVEEASK